MLRELLQCQTTVALVGFNSNIWFEFLNGSDLSESLRRKAVPREHDSSR